MGSYENYPKELLDEIYSFFENNEFCDVTLVAGINKLKLSAHRLILSAASSYFRSMFSGNFIESDLKEIPLPDVNGYQLQILLRFCYTGKIQITKENVYDILKVASPLGFTYIESKCAEFLKGTLSVSSCLTIWNNVEQYMNFKDLVELAINYAKVHFTDVTETDEFFELDPERLLMLLKSDDLNVWSEEEVFNALVDWVIYDEETRAQNVHDLLTAIRFTQLKPHFICGKVEEFCKKFNSTDLIENVYKWVLLPHTQENPIEPRPPTAVKRLITIGCNGKDYIGGRRQTKNYYSEVYCPIAKKWKIYKEYQCKRFGFCSVLVNTDLYVFGGKDLDRTVLRTAEKFNFITKKLDVIESLDKDRLYSAAAVLNDHIYVAGGVDLKAVSKFNVTTQKWSSAEPMHEERSSFGLISLNGRLFAIGGYSQFGYLASVEQYDPFENEWKHVLSMLRHRSGHSLAVHRDRIYVFGGAKQDGLEISIEYYEPITNSWTLIYSLSCPGLHRMATTIIDDFLYIAGGVDDKKCNVASVIRMDLKTDWFNQQIVAPMNYKRSFFGLFQLPLYN